MAVRNLLKKITIHSQYFCLYRKYSFTNRVCVQNYNRPTVIVNKRFINDNYTSDLEPNDEDFEIGDTNEQVAIRNLLYSNSKDVIIQELNECASVQNVFNLIQKYDNKLDETHISQAVLVLWDLQKIFYKHNMFFGPDHSNSLLNQNAILKNYINQVNAHEDFEKLLKLIEAKYENFSLDALTCTMLYLNRMGINLNSEIMQLLVKKCENDIRNCRDIETFPLSVLSRFIVVVNSHEDFKSILATINADSIVLQRLDSCYTADEFKLLTICLNKMNELATEKCLETYKKIGNKLIDNGIITREDKRTVIKCLRFLNQPQWFEYNTDISSKFMSLLKGSISDLNNRDLILLFKVFQMQKEPADILEEIQNHASKLLADVDMDENLELTLDLLSCIVSFSPPLQRPKFENIAKRYVKNNLSPSSLTALYKILYHIKSSDKKLCNHFWDTSLEFLTSDTHNKMQNLLSLCHKYTHFSTDLSNRYRYFHFEKVILKLIQDEIDKTEIPNSKFASFIIAYSNDSLLINRVINNLLENTAHLGPLDVLYLSKGLNFAIENNKFRNDSNLAENLDKLSQSLNEITLNLVKNQLKLTQINILLRSALVRKSNLFEKLLEFYENSNEFSSHIIKDVSFTLQVNNFLMPQVIETSINYILEKQENILGNTIDKLLHLCYILGYTPKQGDEFFTIVSKIIIRDKERFSGLAFLQSCLALCFYHKLPEELIKLVFSVEFLEKLDEELANCYAKTTYPVRVRDHLMQLNRAVCLDYPESNIPWFHQKYIEEFKKQTPRNDFFHTKIQTILDVLSPPNITEIIENSYSPYGYHLDFEIKYNDSSRAVLLLLNNKAFTNHSTNIKGFFQLKQRHLEILGYKVIAVNLSEWKTLYTQESCIEWLKNKLCPYDKALSSMSY